MYLVSLSQTSVAVGDIQDVRQNALLRQRELHVRVVFHYFLLLTPLFVFVFVD